MVKRDQAEKWLSLAGSVALPLVGGMISSIPTAKAVSGPGAWYNRLNKPKWTPPTWVFGPAWSVFYVAQGVASWLVWRKRGPLTDVKGPLVLYGVQLALNLLWSPLFFGKKRLDLATIDSAAMVGVATAATVQMAKIAGNKEILPIMVPYLGWLTFATALTGAISQRNPGSGKIGDTLQGAAKGAKSNAENAANKADKATSEAAAKAK